MRTSLIPLLMLAFGSSASAQPLRVVTNEIEPFFYLKNGKPAGLEYDILRYFAEAQGRELDIHWAESFEQVLPTVERGEADIGSATLTITPERQERFDFSESYFPVRIMLVEPVGQKTMHLESLSGATFSTLADSTYETLLSTVSGAKFLYARNDREMYELVATGKASALASDSAVAFSMLRDFQSLHLGIPLSEEQQYGFALAKGSPLTNLLSEHILKLKGSGIYFRLLEQHLGAEAVEVVKAGKTKK